MRRLRLAVPAAAASLFGATLNRNANPGDCLLQSGGSHARVYQIPAVAMSRATAVGLSARLLPGRPRGIVRFAEAVCRLGCAPTAAESATWRPVPCAVHLPACRDMIAAWHVEHGIPCLAGFPRQTPGLPQARPACRTTGYPAYDRSATVCAELLRRAQDMPWTSGWPRRCRHKTAPNWGAFYTHHQRVTIPVLLNVRAATGSAPLSAPRHYREPPPAKGRSRR